MINLFDHSVSKAILAKARRLIEEDKVIRVGENWIVTGDTGERLVTGDAGNPIACSCPTPTRTLCSHRLAVLMLAPEGRIV